MPATQPPALVAQLAWTLVVAALLAEAALAQTAAPATDGVLTDRPAGKPLQLPDDEPAFLFAVFGDRTGGPADGVQILAQAVDEVNLIEPDLVLTVGDLVQGYCEEGPWLEQMREYTGIMDGLSAPWFPVAGNHDVYWRGQGSPPAGEHEGLYEQHFGPLWYAFQHKQSWFIVLYTDEGDPQTGAKDFRVPETQRMSREQFGWLSRTLQRAQDAQHVFVFVHHPRWIGGGYGDDWDKVHELLVTAGNVSAVFGGHIHRMRYDPRDGIEYFSLATTGGGQGGVVPEAGWLHHYELVMVRDDHIAVASYPVGTAADPRALTGDVVLEAERLARSFGVTLGDGLTLDADFAADAELPLRLHNPVEHPVAVTLVWQADDERWAVRPDHVHVTLEPGASLSVPSRVTRAAGGDVGGLSLDVSLELQLERLAIPLPTRRVDVPISARVQAPPVPEREQALHCDGVDDALAVDSAALGLPDGPLTVEARVALERVDGHQGLVAKTQGSEFGLFVSDGVPGFWLHLDGEYTVLQAPEQRLTAAGWYDLAAVFDGDQLRLYVDGRQVAATAAAGRRTPNDLPLLIGADVDADGSATSAFAGWLDEVRVSSSARYDGALYTPSRRLLSDADTHLLLHADAVSGAWLHDASERAAHPRRRGGVRVAPAP